MTSDQMVFEAAFRECRAAAWYLAAGYQLGAVSCVLRAIVFLYDREGTSDIPRVDRVVRGPDSLALAASGAMGEI